MDAIFYSGNVQSSAKARHVDMTEDGFEWEIINWESLLFCGILCSGFPQQHRRMSLRKSRVYALYYNFKYQTILQL